MKFIRSTFNREKGLFSIHVYIAIVER